MKLRLATCVALVFAALGFAAAVSAADNNGVHYYVSLGDSLAQSFQPPFDFEHGYAEQLYASLSANDPKLRLIKLGCGGETTLTMVDGSMPIEGRGARFFCNYPHGSQLAEAVNFLQAHAGFVQLVTIDIGANDFFEFGSDAPAVIQANLPRILSDLRAAAGPDVPIVGMNYYDPFVAPVWFETHSVAAVQAEAAMVASLNDFLEGFYAAAGDPIADVESAFQVLDTTLIGGTPTNVVRACAWTWICAAPPLGPDIHANTAGYGVIAGAFAAAIP